MRTLLLCNCFYLLAVLTAGAQSKPQTPVPPFPYPTDSVEYENESRTVHLGASFSYPPGKGPFPAMILISGSGQQDRDATLFGHKPFAVLADYFTRKGFAVLRVDDRGRGKSRGEQLKATSADFAEDVLAGIQYLLGRKEVDPRRIGLLGHSEGGFIAPIVYSKYPRLAFIISLAGTGVPGADILLKQQTDPVKTMASRAAYEAFYDLTRRKMDLLRNSLHQPDSLVLDSVKKIYAQWKAGQPDSILLPLRADKASPDQYAAQVKTERIPWLKYFIATDPAKFWEKVQCPVLALNGDKDIQVYAEENLSAIRKALRKGGNRKVKTQVIPGLNHLFQHCTSCTIPEYAQLEETFAPEVMQIMLRWLHKTLR